MRAPLVLLALLGCAPAPREEGFRDEARARGLAFETRGGRPDVPTILEANGSGCALLDLGGDGDLDAVVGDGTRDLSELISGPGGRLAVFENRGAGRFVRRDEGVAGDPRAFWTGLASGDFDGDGRADLVAGGFGTLRLLRQLPDGRLAPFAPEDLLPEEERLVPGTPRSADRAPGWVTSLAPCDLDRDGNLDLYVGRYLDLDPLAPPRGELGEESEGLGLPCLWKGHPVYCGPRGLPAQADRILAGEGRGGVEDATPRWCGALPPSYTLGVVPFDAEGDGDTDLYVAVDSEPNRLLVNEIGTQGRLVERAFSAGVAVDPDGVAQAGMGVAAGDVNRDGRVDLVVGNFSGEATELYLGARVGFLAASYRSGLASLTRPRLTFAVHLVDFDGDGWLELFQANGHVYPQADLPGTGTRYAQPADLVRFGAQGRATRVELPGSCLDVPAVLRAASVGDVDGDAAPDLLVTRRAGALILAMNRLGNGANRLEVRLEGSGEPGPGGHRSPRDATGTRVVVRLDPEAGSSTREAAGLLRECFTAQGYQAASSPWLSFGLGSREGYRGLEVRWPSGRVETLGPGRGNRRLWIREGAGVVREVAW